MISKSQFKFIVPVIPSVIERFHSALRSIREMFRLRFAPLNMTEKTIFQQALIVLQDSVFLPISQVKRKESIRVY